MPGGGLIIVRPLRFHTNIVTFNALCVLAGALALDKEDRAVVIPDSTGLKSLIAKGFFDLQDMVGAIGLAWPGPLTASCECCKNYCA